MPLGYSYSVTGGFRLNKVLGIYFKKAFEFILFSIFIFATFLSLDEAFAAKNICAKSFEANRDESFLSKIKWTADLKSSRSPEQIKNLRLGTYNVYNLYQEVRDQAVRDDYLQKMPVNAYHARQSSLDGVAKAINESNLDIVVVQEVEHKSALQRFSDERLGGQYQAFILPGNDGRGIHIGMLVRKDLGFAYEYVSNRNHFWKDPVSKQHEFLIKRDLPMLLVKDPKTNEIVFVVLGAHLKSKRDRQGDPNSSIARTAEAERVAEIITNLQKSFGEKTPILLAGDFNGDVHTDPDLNSLRQHPVLKNVFSSLDPAQLPSEKVTHTFHPFGGKTSYSQLDTFWVSESLLRYISYGEIYRYTDAYGKELPIPSNIRMRKKNPSDHFPVIIEWTFDYWWKNHYKNSPQAMWQQMSPLMAA